MVLDVEPCVYPPLKTRLRESSQCAPAGDKNIFYNTQGYGEKNSPWFVDEASMVLDITTVNCLLLPHIPGQHRHNAIRKKLLSM